VDGKLVSGQPYDDLARITTDQRQCAIEALALPNWIRKEIFHILDEGFSTHSVGRIHW
jgi:hypothetical protein